MLTAFGEGLSCKYFDAKNSYYVRMINKETLTWLVMSKNVGETEKPPSSDSYEQVMFDRCRKVTVRNGLMDCDCGRTQQFLMPCSHICAVIAKKEYMDPRFYHIRWYKTFAYYWKQPYSNNLAPNVKDALNQRFEADKSLFCKVTGKFLGIDVRNSLFFESIKDNYSVECNDEITQWMKIIREKTLEGAVPKGTISKGRAISILNEGPNEDYFSGKLLVNGFTQNDTFTETFSQLSQQREEIELSSLESSIVAKPKNEYNTTLALFKEAYNVCRTEENKKCLQDTLQKFIVSTVTKNNKDYYSNVKGTTFYGGDLENRKTVRRTYSKAEQILRQSKKKK